MANGVPSRAKTFRNLALFCLAVAAVGVFVPLPSDFNILFGIFGALGALGFGVAWLLAPRPLPNEAPDVIGEIASGYFEQDGLCFAPAFTVEDGLCWFTVYCQNRYNRRGRGTAVFIPMEGVSKAGAHEVPPINVDIG